MTDNAHIQVRDLKICYGNLEVIHGIDFTVKRGEFVSIIGKSGCGKSSLLHALAGFIEKTGDVDIPADAGMVFQNYAIFPWQTVQGNIGFGLQGVQPEKKRELVAKHLQMTGLVNEARNYPYQLSGGQAQRVALARALAPNPSVILMDEPFGALDQFTREKMQAWLLDIWEENHKTVIFVTHNLEEAIYLSDRVIVMGQGRILGEFPVPFGRPRAEQLKFTAPFVTLKKQVLDVMEGN
jgi:NitT/TauT family transport system ATP-binding protein